MISKGLLNYSFYRLFKHLYYNYLTFNENKKPFKQRVTFNNNVTEIKYDYKYRK